MIIATIPFAIVIGGGAAGIGAALQGLVMWFMLAVAIGAFVYMFVVLKLLDKIERLETQLRRERFMMEQFGRNTYNYR